MARKKAKSENDPIDPEQTVSNGPSADEPAFLLPDEPDLVPISQEPVAPQTRVDLEAVPEPEAQFEEEPEPAPVPEPAPAPEPVVKPPVAPASRTKPTARPTVPIVTHSTAPPPPEIDSLEERMRRLEQAITSLAAMQPPPQPATPPSMLSAANMLVEASRKLMPPVYLDAGPRPGQPGRFWLITDTLAELQAIYYMYVDPRYRLSWLGRIIPPTLLVLFCTTDWWVKYALCGLGALPLVDKPIQLLLAYLLYKIVGLEARHYRQTAPDLPPSLRL